MKEFLTVSSKSGKIISFLPENIDVSVSQKDHSVLAVAIRAKVPLNHTCGGNATCGTCRVLVVKGLEKLPPRNELEQEMAEDRGFQPFERLACQIEPVDGLTVEIPLSDD
ncbi:fdx [Bdellovibrio bacteriovorus HD100]|uniref:Fdx protein n=1 Tax=Bdellovibrio bacteriovorus (strain ATCC 15356 / DSM 50701 / NCIMB 9529 / HD100) TaxID=264462 RepID=Q6MGT8_BDEBA|nr:hypothetical protein EP01_11665 [Bdellovibrio bacteriovorus]CAE81191.1 fdx [Bdellovibrio bacteriovorus HD100]